MILVVSCCVSTVSAYKPTYTISKNVLEIDYHPNATVNKYDSGGPKDGEGDDREGSMLPFYTKKIPELKCSFNGRIRDNVETRYSEHENDEGVITYVVARTGAYANVDFSLADNEMANEWKWGGFPFEKLNLKVKSVDVTWLIDGKEVKEHKTNLKPNQAMYFFDKYVPNGKYAKISKLKFTLDKNIPISSASKKPDLKIGKITKKGNTFTGSVKNTGKGSAAATNLGIYVDSKLIKKIKIDKLAPGKSYTFKTTIDKKYAKQTKTFKTDINNYLKVNKDSKKIK